MRKFLKNLFCICLLIQTMFVARAESVTFNLSSDAVQALEYTQQDVNGIPTVILSNGAIDLTIVGYSQHRTYAICSGSQLDVSFNPNSRFSTIVISHVKIDFGAGIHIVTGNLSGAYTLDYEDINANSFSLSTNGVEAKIEAVTVTFDPVVTVEGAGYATLYLNDAANIPVGVNVFTAELSEDKAMLQPVEGTVIPAKTGVILQGQGTFTFTHTSEAGTPVIGNILVGCNTKTYAEDFPGTLYALGIKNEVLGFYRLSLDTSTGHTSITPYKAYLLVDGSSSKPSVITWTDEALGMPSVPTQQCVDATYDLQGRQMMNKPQSVSLQKGNVIIR